jgi:hypothetical protein
MVCNHWMASPMVKSETEKTGVELRPDGWARFKRAVDSAVKSGPKHRITPKAKESYASKGRVHKGKTRA